MATLSANMNQTASQLIEKYGNSTTLTSNAVSGGYDPLTGQFSVNTATDYVIKSVWTKPSQEALNMAGIEETAYGSISTIYTISYQTEFATIDNSWKVDGKRIHKVVENRLQDEVVTLQLFVG